MRIMQSSLKSVRFRGHNHIQWVGHFPCWWPTCLWLFTHMTPPPNPKPWAFARYSPKIKPKNLMFCFQKHHTPNLFYRNHCFPFHSADVVVTRNHMLTSHTRFICGAYWCSHLFAELHMWSSYSVVNKSFVQLRISSVSTCFFSCLGAYLWNRIARVLKIATRQIVQQVKHLPCPTHSVPISSPKLTSSDLIEYRIRNKSWVLLSAPLQKNLFFK